MKCAPPQNKQMDKEKRSGLAPNNSKNQSWICMQIIGGSLNGMCSIADTTVERRIFFGLVQKTRITAFGYDFFQTRNRSKIALDNPQVQDQLIRLFNKTLTSLGFLML